MKIENFIIIYLTDTIVDVSHMFISNTPPLQYVFICNILIQFNTLFYNPTRFLLGMGERIATMKKAENWEYILTE